MLLLVLLPAGLGEGGAVGGRRKVGEGEIDRRKVGGGEIDRRKVGGGGIDRGKAAGGQIERWRRNRYEEGRRRGNLGRR